MSATLTPKKISWQTQTRNITDLIPAKYNPRRLTKKQFDELSTSIERFSLADPIVINSDNTVIGGHQRIKVLKEKGIAVVYVRVPDRVLTPDEERELNLRLNKNLGEFDFEKLADFDQKMLESVGFTQLEIKSIFNLDVGWNPPKTDEALAGDGIGKLAGYSLSSFWKDIRNENSPVHEYFIPLPLQANTNLVRQSYSRTNLEEIMRIVKTYMRPGDYFLENCCGWSTFGSSARFFGYSGVGVDIWQTALDHSRAQLERV